MNAVTVDGVWKTFGPRRVWAGLDLAVRRGEVLTVLGPSGSGKSVLLRLIVGLLKPEAGRVLVGEEDVVPLGERALRRVRRRIGFLFQGAALFDSMSVGENVAWALLEHERWPAARVRGRVDECLHAVGLPGIERMRPSQLSGGMKKRVALARALAPGPDLILYDEPTTGLDPANARRINELILDLRARAGVTSIVITHDIAGALAVSDRLGLIIDGKVPALYTPDEARADPAPALRAFMEGREGRDHEEAP